LLQSSSPVAAGCQIGWFSMTEHFTPGRGQQPALASAWVDAAMAGTAAWTAWYTTALSLGMSLWAQALPASYGSRRSWYRPPVETASYLTAWLPASRGTETAFDWWRAAASMPLGWSTQDSRSLEMMRIWMTGLTVLSVPLIARMLYAAADPGRQSVQLAFPWPLGAAPRSEPAPFAFYRSDSGHATAQIVVPEMVVAAAVWPLFGVPFWR
jgi:hypothetical protein